MTTLQIQQAIQMHDKGMSRTIVSAYFKVSADKLRKQIKHYEATYQSIHSTIGEG